MTGRNHERVPGRDQAPLIGITSDSTGHHFTVRLWDGEVVGRLSFPGIEKAIEAEKAFRASMVTCAKNGGDVRRAMRSWFDNMGDLPDWWS